MADLHALRPCHASVTLACGRHRSLDADETRNQTGPPIDSGHQLNEWLDKRRRPMLAVLDRHVLAAHGPIAHPRNGRRRNGRRATSAGERRCRSRPAAGELLRHRRRGRQHPFADRTRGRHPRGRLPATPPAMADEVLAEIRRLTPLPIRHHQHEAWTPPGRRRQRVLSRRASTSCRGPLRPGRGWATTCSQISATRAYSRTRTCSRRPAAAEPPIPVGSSLDEDFFYRM